METIKVFVGADRSQWIGVKVLEHSIHRHSKRRVEVIPMVDLPVRPPRDPKQDQRTGFSFSRFIIPKLCGYQGRAIYMDADMLVFRDIGELWDLPMEGAKVLVQEELTGNQAKTASKRGAPPKRIRQCSVMVLDCARLDWDIDRIIDGLDQGKYDYAKLMYELCILTDGDVGARIPFRWNSLEHYDSTTANIHYTDMGTQPWVWSANRHGDLWVRELTLMIQDGSLSPEQLNKEIKLGYARPSLLGETAGGGWRDILPRALAGRVDWIADRLKGFRPHKVAFEDRNRWLADRRMRLAS